MTGGGQIQKSIEQQVIELVRRNGGINRQIVGFMQSSMHIALESENGFRDGSSEGQEMNLEVYRVN